MKVENQTDYSLLLRRQSTAADSGSGKAQSGADASDAVALTRPVRIGQSVLYVSLSRTLSFSNQSGASSTSTAGTQTAQTDSRFSVASSEEDDDTVTPTEDNPLGFNYKKVAKNVLGFVTGYLRKAQAEGKDDATLKDLLGQARKGIDQGFGQARDELKGTGLFSEELDKGISKSYDTIQTGLDKFEKDLLGTQDATASTPATSSTTTGDSATSRTASTTTPAATVASTTPAATANSASTGVDSSPAATSLSGVKGLSALLGSGQSASLSLTTRDGDKITIAFDQQSRWQWQQGSTSTGVGRKALDAYQQTSQQDGQGAASRATGAGNSSGGALYYAQTAGFSFSVQGNLSQDELKAVGGLVDQIGGLSDSFFSGDLQGALDQAQKLSWDDSQVAGFALNLHQSQWAALATDNGKGSNSANSQTDSSSTTNSANSGTGTSTGITTDNSSLATLFAPFADYLQRLQTMIRDANTLFDQSGQDQLSRWVANQQQARTASQNGTSVADQRPADQSAADQFVSFNTRMHQAMQALGSSGGTAQA